jgi:hypothetical protein
LLVWSGVGAAAAREIHVDNKVGDDRYDGSAAVTVGRGAGPYRTLARALRAACKGDRVIVANTGDPYRESLTLQGGRHSGTPDAPFAIIGNGAVLEGLEPVPAEAWEIVEGSSLFRFRPPRMAFQVLYLDGKPAPRRVARSANDIGLLRPLEWCLYEGYVFFRVEPNRPPQTYALAYTALPVGITLYEVRYVVIRDLVIQGFQLDGVNAHDGVRETSLISLNCRGNGRSGISVGGASRVRVDTCLVGNNGVAQVRTEGVSHTELVGCDLLENPAPRVLRDGGDVREAR